VRAIGVRALAATMFNVMIGGGIFLLPGVVAAGLGDAAPLAYLACAVAMGLIVLCFAEAGSRVSITGGPYAYVEVALGPFVGFIAGVLLWLQAAFAMAAVATGFALAVGFLVPALNDPTWRVVILVALFASLAAINYRGVRQAARFVEAVTVAKILPLLALVVAGVVFLARSPEANVTLWPERLPDATAFGTTVVTLFFAFAGLESALAPSGEVREPSRTVPRALAIAMLTVTALYIALHLVAAGLLGTDGLAAQRDAPLAAAGRVAMGTAGGMLVAIGAAISMFGNVTGMTLATPRMLFAFARDGVLPRALLAVHPRFRTPHVAIVVQSTIVCLMAVTSGFEQMARLAILSVLMLYLFCCVSTWVLRRKDVRTEGEPFRIPGGALVPLLGCAAIVWLLTTARLTEFAIVAGIVVVAGVVRMVTRRA
jgi:APA family basic amino acid/polyamine antiporter